MGVEKMSVSFDLALGQAIRQSAQHSAQSVSAWLADAAADRLRREAVGEWQGAFGALTESEIADADRVLDRAPHGAGVAVPRNDECRSGLRCADRLPSR